MRVAELLSLGQAELELLRSQLVITRQVARGPAAPLLGGGVPWPGPHFPFSQSFQTMLDHGEIPALRNGNLKRQTRSEHLSGYKPWFQYSTSSCRLRQPAQRITDSGCPQNLTPTFEYIAKCISPNNTGLHIVLTRQLYRTARPNPPPLLTMATNTLNIPEDELFIQPSSDPTPDRHPSILRPGGHSSPLKYPAVLRPGAARRSRTPSPSGDVASPTQHPTITTSPPPVAYKAYSPARPQSPNDDLSAEIEGYFTALEVPPLHINKPSSPEPSAAPLPPQPQIAAPHQQRPTSPPVPPKEKISIIEPERHVVSPVTELDASIIPDHRVVSPLSESDTTDPAPQAMIEDDVAEAPPAYDESSRVTPPPEKPRPHRLSDHSLAGAAAASAAQVGGSVGGFHADEAIVDAPSPAESPAVKANVTSEAQAESSSKSDANLPPPPPLPPRPAAAEASDKDKCEEPAMPGAFPPPPTRPPPSSSYKVGGAAATSAASVGAAVAGVGQSAGLKQARKAFEKRIGHMIDKAKEHHQAREHQRAGGHEKKASTSRKASPEGDAKKKKKGDIAGPVAEVSTDHSYGIRMEAECLFV